MEVKKHYPPWWQLGTFGFFGCRFQIAGKGLYVGGKIVRLRPEGGGRDYGISGAVVVGTEFVWVERRTHSDDSELPHPRIG